MKNCDFTNNYNVHTGGGAYLYLTDYVNLHNLYFYNNTSGKKSAGGMRLERINHLNVSDV